MICGYWIYSILLSLRQHVNRYKFYIMGEKAEGEKLRELKEEIGIVLDDVGCPECITPRQIDRIMEGTFRHWNSEKYRSLISKFGLEENKKFGDMSKGMKMKMGIAAAMSHGAKLLILDEPFVGLDPKAAKITRDYMHDFCKKGGIIFFSTHHRYTFHMLCKWRHINWLNFFYVIKHHKFL